MKNFAKIFETKEYGQILVQIKTEDDEEVISISIKFEEWDWNPEINLRLKEGADVYEQFEKIDLKIALGSAKKLKEAMDSIES